MRERCDGRTAGASVASMVIVDQPEDVAERIELGVEVRVVETQPTVHDQTWQSRADFDVEEIRTVYLYVLLARMISYTSSPSGGLCGMLE